MIKNKTKNKVLVNQKKMCKSEWCKAKGLMFSKKIKDKGLIFVFDKMRRAGLHMFFVFFPIDVLFLDENMVVVDMKEHFKPFMFYTPRKRVKYIIELPDSTIKKTLTKVGDKIVI